MHHCSPIHIAMASAVRCSPNRSISKEKQAEDLVDHSRHNRAINKEQWVAMRAAIHQLKAAALHFNRNMSKPQSSPMRHQPVSHPMHFVAGRVQVDTMLPTLWPTHIPAWVSQLAAALPMQAASAAPSSHNKASLSAELLQWRGPFRMDPWALPTALGKTMARLLVELLPWALTEVLPACQWGSLVAQAKCQMANPAPSVKPRILPFPLLDMADSFTVALTDNSSLWSRRWQLRQSALHAVVATPALSAQCERRGQTVAECSSAARSPKASSASSSNSPMSHHVQSAPVAK